MNQENTKVGWPDSLAADFKMRYESICPLYKHDKPSITELGFVVSCGRNGYAGANIRGCLHKIEVELSRCKPELAAARMDITHEVLPGLGASSQIIPVNNKLLAACFDEAAVMPIKNFGYKKTFNSDVRGSLRYPTGSLNVIATDGQGQQLATGSVDAWIVLHRVREEEITFLSRTKLAGGMITGLSYLQPHKDQCVRPKGDEVLAGENVLIYSTDSGHLGVLDTRVELSGSIEHILFMDTNLNISSLCFMNNLPHPVLFLGTQQGEVRALDLRNNKRYIYSERQPDDGYIRRMKQIIVKDAYGRDKTFLAYTNSSNQIKIYDAMNMKSQEDWICDRLPEGDQQDLCQIGDRIVTCGDNCSIGGWVWNNTNELLVF